jgi:acyl carrier protein phosphodiesterase
VNFLAHCLLAANAKPDDEPLTEDLIAGGLLGDFVKGAVPEQWPASLQTGVRLHRRIDAYSNQMPGIRISCDRFPTNLRRFAPIFVDVVADHCLALDWAGRHHQTLNEFSKHCYASTTVHAHRLSKRQQRYIDWMVEDDLLANYASFAVMERGLYSITRRLKREELNGQLADFVHTALPALKDDFLTYFPDLESHAQSWVRTVDA